MVLTTVLTGVCGVVSLVGAPVDPSLLDHLRAGWQPDQQQVWGEGPVVLCAAGGGLFPADPHRAADDAVLATMARLDPPFDAGDAKMDEVVSEGGFTNPAGRSTDAQRVRASYRSRGEHAPEYLFGDWMFAAWHAGERRLVLARDQVGTAGVYYYADSRWFAFASDVAVLRALPFVPDVVDEAWLAESLFGWTDPKLERTSLAGVRRLAPGHLLTVTGGRLRIRRYWHPTEVPLLDLPSRADYAMQLREVLTVAVASRLPATGDVASHLSGGMDSGTVAVMAARLLAPQGRSLHAFTASAPGSYGQYFDPESLVEEWPLAAATAAVAANIEQRRVSGEAFTPVAAMRRWLQLGGEPIRNPSNLAWILQITDTVRAAGYSTLLTGSMGNLTISWRGPETDRLGPWTALRRRATGRLPAGLHTRLKGVYHPHWYRECAVHPRLLSSPAVQAMLAEQREPPAGPAERRHRTLLRAAGGAAILGFQGRAHGIDILDPTGDMRVVSFTLSVPPHHYIDPATGMRRWLIREATKDILPEQVRLNKRGGRQGVDFVPRLRASSTEVTDTLHELAGGPAADYIDVGYLTRTWAYIQGHDNPESFIKASRILGRGLMTGMYINTTNS